MDEFLSPAIELKINSAQCVDVFFVDQTPQYDWQSKVIPIQSWPLSFPPPLRLHVVKNVFRCVFSAGQPIERCRKLSQVRRPVHVVVRRNPLRNVKPGKRLVLDWV